MTTLTDIMNSITNVTNAILEYTDQSPPDFIQISDLPCYSKQDELMEKHHCSIDVSNSIDPQQTLRQALNKMFVDGEQSSRLLQRWPGLVVYNDDHPCLQDLIELLNIEKTRFKDLIDDTARGNKKPAHQGAAAPQTSDDDIEHKINPSTLRDRKWELIHSTYSMLVTLYVYRKVKLVSGPVTASYFNWLRAPNVRRVGKAELINHLEWQLKQAETSAITHYDTSAIGRAISIASSSSRNEYIQRIVQPPRPNLVLHFLDERKPKGIYGGLPVFLFNQAGHPFNYKPLKSFDEDALKSRKPRADAKILEPFFGNYFYAP